MARPERDPYAILGVPSSASRETVAAAYRRLARQHHPDAGSVADQSMRDLNWAWGIVSVPSRRRAWDAQHAGRGGTAAGHWAGDRSVPPPWQPPASGWAASGEAWAGGHHVELDRASGFGCLPLAMAAVVLAVVILFTGLGSGRPPVVDGGLTSPPLASEAPAP
jgi:DnaJ domain